MQDLRQNNPHAFSGTVSIDAWRTSFIGQNPEANLHIDVVFSTSRVGGNGNDEHAAVRFRLSLRRAEIHIIRDRLGIIEIPPKSVARTAQPVGRAVTVSETERAAKLEGEVNLSAAHASAGLKAAGDASLRVTSKIEEAFDATQMKINHMKTPRGYAFRIEPSRGDRLDGQPWPADESRLRLRDTNPSRKFGDAPDVAIEAHCLREDLIIENVEFTDESIMSWNSLTRSKKIAVEQYIKDVLFNSGLPCGDMREPFSRIVLANINPYID